MAITIATPTEEQWPDMFRADARAFGFVPEPGDLEARRPIIDLGRFRVALDGRAIVGVAGSYALDATLPGGSTVPTAGVTWVSVAATHRRQGILTRLMAACHDDADARGEVAAILFASEGGIYERFGYGIATQHRGASIDRRAARFRADVPHDPTAVRYLEPDEAQAHGARIWEGFRRRRAGEVSRSEAWQTFLHGLWSKPSDGMSASFHLGHEQGYAVYRIKEKWTAHGPDHHLDVREVVATSDRAHLDLWRAIVGIDLVSTITVRSLPIDDPLPCSFTDQRVVRTTSLTDGVWANVRDVAVCFGARSYGTADRIVVECDGRRWAIEGDAGGGSCRAVRARPDLTLDHPSLGALLLGGTRPSQLAAAGRLVARSDEALRRADVFFVASPAPNCLTFF
jgi:predicted acetyltransferase